MVFQVLLHSQHALQGWHRVHYNSYLMDFHFQTSVYESLNYLLYQQTQNDQLCVLYKRATENTEHRGLTSQGSRKAYTLHWSGTLVCKLGKG